MSLQGIQNANLAFCLKKDGLPVAYNGFTTYGFLLHEPVDGLQLTTKDFAVKDTILVLTIQTGSIGPIQNTVSNLNVLIKSLITVNGTQYKIDDNILTGDGLTTKLFLSGAD